MKKKLLSLTLLISFGINAQSWTEKATGFTNPNRSLNSISIVDANVIWANAFDNTDQANQDYTIKEFTKSIDGGEIWTAGTIDLGANSADMEVSSITAASATTAWVSVSPGISNTGGIWKTIDGGTNWIKQTTALFNSVDSYPNFVHFWNSTDGIAQGDPESGEFEIYTTNDGGTTWTRVSGANISDPSGGEIGYYNLYTVSGNTIWFGTSTGRIFRSTDKGLNWTAYNSVYSTDFSLDRFTFSDANKGLLMTYFPVNLYNTTDGGATWNPVSKTGSVFNVDISYIPGTSIVVSSAYANPLGSSYSLDDGLTWNTIDTNVFHGKLAFLNDNFGFSAGQNTNATTGGISKLTGIPLKNPNFEINNQSSVYPNPTNGILHVDSEKGIKEASIFNLLGQKVFSSKFPVLNSVSLDLHSLQTGNYVLKTTSNDGKTESTKILKK
ncbi:MAG: T9SS type A sorting domain-containing protein [Bacteroidota bacterium]